MKKVFFIFVVILAPLLVLTACAKNTAVSGQQKNQVAEQTSNRRLRQPDFGQPERQPDIRGIVKSILSNEVTVLKIDRPGFNGRASSTATASEPGSGTNSSTTRNAASFSLSGATGPGAGRGMMPGGPGGHGPEEQTTETRAQLLAKLKEMSTGEEKIIIPVGIKMLKMEISGKTRTTVEASLADISADKSLTIWLNAGVTDKKVAEFVLIN